MLRGGDMRKNSYQQPFQARLGKVPSVEKYRRMACSSFIMAGQCPYQARCVFLHDPRVESADILPHKPQKQTKGAGKVPKDAWYWPDMDKKEVLKTPEYANNILFPACFQPYVIPQDFASSNAHDRGAYSLWNHFAEFVASPSASDNLCNACSNRHLPASSRLPVFVNLAAGATGPGLSKPVVRQQESAAKNEQKWSDDTTDVSCSTSEGEYDWEDDCSNCDDYDASGRGGLPTYAGSLGPDWFSELAVPFISSRSRINGFDVRMGGAEIKDFQHIQDCVCIDKLVRELTTKCMLSGYQS